MDIEAITNDVGVRPLTLTGYLKKCQDIQTELFLDLSLKTEMSKCSQCCRRGQEVTQVSTLYPL